MLLRYIPLCVKSSLLWNYVINITAEIPCTEECGFSIYLRMNQLNKILIKINLSVWLQIRGKLHSDQESVESKTDEPFWVTDAWKMNGTLRGSEL